MNPFIALVSSATTGMSCNLIINGQRQVWHMSASVDDHLYTGRSDNQTITRHTAMMTVEAGYPNTPALEFNGKLLDIKLNGNVFLQSPYVAEDRVCVGHCEQSKFEGL